MNNAGIQLVVLAVIAVIVFLKLRSVLGTRDGFEVGDAPVTTQRKSNVVPMETAFDMDIADHFDLNSISGKALAEMKKSDPNFNVDDFVSGAKQAYEMILLAFEGDDLETLQTFLSDDVYAGFKTVIDARQAKGLSVDAKFIGVRNIQLVDAAFDPSDKLAEITVSYEGELISVVKDAKGKIVEGDAEAVKRQRDEWTFARTMDSSDPNWELVETAG